MYIYWRHCGDVTQSVKSLVYVGLLGLSLYYIIKKMAPPLNCKLTNFCLLILMRVASQRTSINQRGAHWTSRRTGADPRRGMRWHSKTNKPYSVFVRVPQRRYAVGQEISQLTPVYITGNPSTTTRLIPSHVLSSYSTIIRCKLETPSCVLYSEPIRSWFSSAWSVMVILWIYNVHGIFRVRYWQQHKPRW